MFKSILIAAVMAMMPLTAQAATFMCAGSMEILGATHGVVLVGKYDPKTAEVTDDPILIIDNRPVYYWTKAETQMSSDGKVWNFAAADKDLFIGIRHPEGVENKTEMALKTSANEFTETKNGNCRFED